MELFFKKFGEAEKAIIIVHGLFGSGDNWQTHAKTLSLNYSVYCIDQRNHGHSPHSEDMNYEVMAGDLVDFIAAEGLRDVILIGHSMGGKTVMKFAMDHAYLVDKLIVVDMGIKQYPPHHTRIFQGLFATKIEECTSRAQVTERLSPYVDDPATLQFLLKNVYWKGEKELAWRFNLPVLHAHLSSITEGLQVEQSVGAPTLFIRGAKSNYILDDDIFDLQQQFPLSKLVTIENAGHWPHAENPTDFMQSIQTFLNE